ncbi:MAG: Na+/H+ antiporter [Phyllobacterium sp.]
METIAIALLLLLAVVISGSLVRMLPVPLPLPLVQVGLGALIASAADFHVVLNPEIFFLLFLPPLLFLDGWRIPKEDAFRDRGIILELALGLVIFTVLGVGLFIHWMIPAMPLAVAFALAAIISPTDPVAVSSLASSTPIPTRLMHILEGESLLNDASGLVCMQFAVAAMLTGVFAIHTAFSTFLWLALGGVAVGIGVTWSVTRMKNWVGRHYGEEAGSQVLISLLIPFGAYILAEKLHCSGILAAVAAGITMSYAEISGQALAITRVRRTAVWDTIQFALNGVIFVLLGEQLPGIFSSAVNTVGESGHNDPWWLAIYVIAINLALAALRFAWVWMSLRFTLLKFARRGTRLQMPSWRLVAATSVAGVRGAITLAGVLTLPLLMNDGTPFPARDLAIFLAAGVILVSLIVATITLPRLLEGLELPPEPSYREREDAARIAAAEAAIKAVEREQHNLSKGRLDADLYASTAAKIMDSYRQRIDGRSATPEAGETYRQMENIERELRLAALKAERNEVFRIARARKLEDETARRLVREIDLIEARYN